MSDKGQQAAIITGGSQGIGASPVTAYRWQGWSVVATARTMKPTEDPDVLIVDGDLADPATADRIVSRALGRFDTLINNGGVYSSKRAIHRAVFRQRPELASMAGRDDQ